MYKYNYIIYKNLIIKPNYLDIKTFYNLYPEYIVRSSYNIDYYLKKGYIFIPKKLNDYTYAIDKLKTNITNVILLYNKYNFSNFMIEYYPNLIPMTYLSSIPENYNNTNRFISKPNISSSGCGIKILNTPEIIENHILCEYLEYDIDYVGHFLVLDGKIVNYVYFYTNKKNDILLGCICNYKITKIINNNSIYNEIFIKLFNKLNYNGFACVDFCILDGNIKIFEINPRIGGSLIGNRKYFLEFLDSFIDNFVD